jgi:VWFA-related protein
VPVDGRPHRGGGGNAESAKLIRQLRKLAVLWFAVPLSAFWLQEAQGPTMRVTSRLVPIDVLVTDNGTGLRVDDLPVDRFRVLDGGRTQAIAQFSSGSRARPLAVAVIVEAAPNTTGNTLPVLASTLAPAFRRLRAEDELMVVRMYPGAEIVQDLTRDREAAAGALQRVAERQPKTKAAARIGPLTEDLHEALLLAARHLRERRPDARAAIVVIAGDWNFTPVPVLGQTAMQLIAAGASVNGLIRVDSKIASAFKGIYGVLPKNKYRDRNIVWYSEQTGGEAIEMKDDGFGAAFEKVIGDIAASYTIAFVPNADLFDDTFHKLTVEVRGPGSGNLIVRARSRYYASLEQTIASEPSPAGGSGQAGSLPGLPSEPGIYYQTGRAYTRVRELDAPRIKITDRHGPAIETAFRLALIQIYSGAKAPLQISNPRPMFIVRPQREPSFARLARLQPMKDERWLRVALFLDKNRATPAMVISRIGGELYRITPAASLPAGEYALSLNETSAPVYDFGIAIDRTP